MENAEDTVAYTVAFGVIFILSYRLSMYSIFALFFVLLTLGMIQTKERNIHLKSVFILPIAMLTLSLYGVVSAFSVSFSPMLCWFVGVILAIILGLIIDMPQNVTFSKENCSFKIPGSWLPMFLIMGIFFIKYAVGVSFARHLSILNNDIFIIAVSLLYGSFSGLFLSRSLVILKSKYQSK